MGLTQPPMDVFASTRAPIGQPWLERQVDAVYIHKVQAETFGRGDPCSWRAHGIHFVDTFVDAAVHAATNAAFSRDAAVGEVRPGSTPCEVAHQLGGWSHRCAAAAPLSSCAVEQDSALILPEGLRRVCSDAVTDFALLDDPKSPHGWAALAGDRLLVKKGLLPALARERDRLKLCQSLAVANEVLVGRFGLTPVALPLAAPVFAPGTVVAIRRDKACAGLAWSRFPAPPVFRHFGDDGGGDSGADGVVRAFRPEDGVYTVELLGWRLSRDRVVTCFLMLDQLAPAAPRKSWKSVKTKVTDKVKWLVGAAEPDDDTVARAQPCPPAPPAPTAHASGGRFGIRAAAAAAGRAAAEGASARFKPQAPQDTADF